MTTKESDSGSEEFLGRMGEILQVLAAMRAQVKSDAMAVNQELTALMKEISHLTYKLHEQFVETYGPPKEKP